MTAPRGLRNEEVVAVLARYGGLVQLWVSRIAPDRADAEDAVHDVFLKLLLYGVQFRELPTEADRHRWLKTLTMRVCLTRRSRARRFPELHDTGLRSTELHSPEFGSAEARSDLSTFWKTLKREERVVGVLYFEEGYTQEEIHELTGRGRPFLIKMLSSIRAKWAQRSNG